MCLNNLLMGVCFGVRTCVARFVVVMFLYRFGLLQRSLYCRKGNSWLCHGAVLSFQRVQNKRLLGINITIILLLFFFLIHSLSFTCFSLCLKSQVTRHTSAFISDSYPVLPRIRVHAEARRNLCFILKGDGWPTLWQGLFFSVIICKFVLSHDSD